MPEEANSRATDQSEIQWASSTAMSTRCLFTYLSSNTVHHGLLVAFSGDMNTTIQHNVMVCTLRTSTTLPSTHQNGIYHWSHLLTLTDHLHAQQEHQYLGTQPDLNYKVPIRTQGYTNFLTCWSIRPIKGLIITAKELSLTASGGKNMQRDFPETVAILKNTSSQWRTGNIASSCPGLNPVNL